jgi:hypothetical protein
MKQMVSKSARYSTLAIAFPFLLVTGLSAFVVCLFLNRREPGRPVPVHGRKAALPHHRS